MSSHGNSDHQRTLNAVITRAETDRAFRDALLTDPRRAIFDAFGVTIPSDFRIRFVEKEPDVDALVVLPDFRPVEPHGAISDTDLEVVSGGAAAHHNSHLNVHANAHLAWKGTAS